MSEDQNQAQPQEKDVVLKANFACKCGYDDIDLNKPIGFCPDCGAALKPQMQKTVSAPPEGGVDESYLDMFLDEDHIKKKQEQEQKRETERFALCKKCKMGYDHDENPRCPNCDTLDTVYDNVELKGLAEIRKEHNRDLDNEAKGKS